MTEPSNKEFFDYAGTGWQDSDAGALAAAAGAALPALTLLGDFIGNTFAGKAGIPAFDRCAIILNLKAALGPAEPREPADLITLAEASLGEGDLDDDVHDAASLIGSSVNNDGVAAQVRFLARQCGVAAARDLVEQAGGREVEP